MSLVPVPSEQQQPETTCANCDAPLVADQRYCLSCGSPSRPCGSPSSMRSHPPRRRPALPGRCRRPGAPGGFELTPSGYVPVQEQGAAGWLRRNSGLLGLLVVLALFLLAGLLVGHWVSESKTPANQTLKIEGLGGLAAGAAAGDEHGRLHPPRANRPRRPRKPRRHRARKTKKSASTKRPRKRLRRRQPKKVSKEKINKLTKSHGKKHQEEINALGATPIETG